MPSDHCPYAPRIADRLADPTVRLDAELAEHLPRCEACRHAASVAVRAWPADRTPSPSLAEWLSEPTGRATVMSPFQAEMLVGGRAVALDLGPYLLLDRLGVGGMGDVFRAWHRLLRREDAVKTVRQELASNANAVKRFLREAGSAAKVRHPNVVQVYTADRAASGYYLAMEFVPGTDLGKLVREGGALPAPVACDYVRQAADGLHHAYTNGLVHRDVKPANLLVTKDRSTVKVADFGLARAFEGAAASEMTAAGAILGTTDYIAPEQAEDARTADTRADVYSLGCTLFFLLTGEVPFPGGGLRNKLERHATAAVPDATARRPGVPPAVSAVVRKCMAKRPADRYQTPGELAAALRAVDRAPPAVVQVTPFDLPEAVERPTEPLPATEPSRERRAPAREPAPGRREPVRKPRRVWLWGGAGLLLLAVGVVVAVATNGPKREDAKGDPQPDPPVVPNPSPAPKPSPNPAPKPDPNPAPKVVPKQAGSKPPGSVPLPRGVGEAPWAFTAACWSERKDKVCAVGFMADGSVSAGRAGDADDGSDAGHWEAWPATGGKATRGARPVGTRDYEYPVFAHASGLYGDRFRRFHPTTLEPLAELATDMTKIDRGTAEGVECLTASGNNKFLVGGVTPAGGNERKMRIVVQWEADTGKVRTGWQVKTTHDLRAVATDESGGSVAVGTWDGKILVLSTKANGEREWPAPNCPKGEPDPVCAIAISPNGKTVYSAHALGTGAFVWDADKGTRLHALPLDWQAAKMTVSPDGRWLVASGPAVRVWDLQEKPPKAYDLVEHWAGDLMTVAFSGDGKRLLVGGWARRGEPTDQGEGVVWLWDLKP